MSIVYYISILGQKHFKNEVREPYGDQSCKDEQPVKRRTQGLIENIGRGNHKDVY